MQWNLITWCNGSYIRHNYIDWLPDSVFLGIVVWLANSSLDLLKSTDLCCHLPLIRTYFPGYFSLTIPGYRIKFSLRHYFQIPETPIWLLSRRRDEEASKSLRWLRGWVSESDICDELNDLKRYREYANSCSDCRTLNIKCGHPLPTLTDKMREVVGASCMKPMIIITMCSLFTSFTGAHHLNPYLVQILKTYQTPIHPSYFTVIIQNSTSLRFRSWFINNSNSINPWIIFLYADCVWHNGAHRYNTLLNSRQVYI